MTTSPLIDSMLKNVAVFGANGVIGKALCKKFLSENYKVIAVTRSQPIQVAGFSGLTNVKWDPFTEHCPPAALLSSDLLTAVVWAQGSNVNDDIYDFNLKSHEEMYASNVTYILQSLHALIANEKLSPSARLCIISSVWQTIARQKKLSYCVTKSALQGLVQSLTIDLGRSGCMVNAVLPGALDTPMTRQNLSVDQISRLQAATPLGRLPELGDVTGIVEFLCSEKNTGITGQFIAADRGFSNARII